MFLQEELMTAGKRKISRRALMTMAVGTTIAHAVSAHAEQPQSARQYIADVVVVGLGAAGAAAAIEAARNGASVLVLEKQMKREHCSNTRLSSGIYQCPDAKVDPEILIRYIVSTYQESGLDALDQGRLDPMLVQCARVWAELAPDNFRWLKSLDNEFNHSSTSLFTAPRFMALWRGQRPHIQAHISTYSNWADFSKNSFNAPKREKSNGEALHYCLMNGVFGTSGIEVHYGMRGSRLLEKDGAIVGVEALANGQKVTCLARKGVILATGGYAFNKRMREAFLPAAAAPFWAVSSSPYNTGDGISAALEQGAALVRPSSYFDRLALLLPQTFQDTRLGVVLSCVGRANSLLVDNTGQRFIAESTLRDEDQHYGFYQKLFEFDSASLTFPRAPVWLIFDDAMMKRGSLTTPGEGSTVNGFVVWGKDNALAIEKGWILKAESLQALTEKIACHPDNCGRMNGQTLLNTVARFNGFCRLGHDQDFDSNPRSLREIKNAPFYAMPVSLDVPHMSCGLRTNADRQVVRWDGSAVEGLYAAGEVAPVSRFVHDRGGHLAECLVFGRHVGRVVASRAARSDF